MSLVAIPGQIALGHLSDRIGREWVWTAGSLGFAICFAALLLMQESPTQVLVYVMVVSQGMLGYGLTSVFGAITAEIFEGRHYGSIFGTLRLASIGGGAVGPCLTGAPYSATGHTRPPSFDRHRPMRRLGARHPARRAARRARRRRSDPSDSAALGACRLEPGESG